MTTATETLDACEMCRRPSSSLLIYTMLAQDRHMAEAASVEEGGVIAQLSICADCLVRAEDKRESLTAEFQAKIDEMNASLTRSITRYKLTLMLEFLGRGRPTDEPASPYRGN